MSIRVMGDVWARSRAKGSALLLLLAIADQARDDGTAWPSVELMSRRIRMSERQVHRLVSHLIALGELRAERQMNPQGRDLVNLYTVRVPAGEGVILAPRRVTPRAAGEGVTGDTQTVTNRHDDARARAREGTGVRAMATPEEMRRSAEAARVWLADHRGTWEGAARRQADAS